MKKCNIYSSGTPFQKDFKGYYAAYVQEKYLCLKKGLHPGI